MPQPWPGDRNHDPETSDCRFTQGPYSSDVITNPKVGKLPSAINDVIVY